MKMSDDDLRKEREKKDAEMHRQEQLGGEQNDRLRGYDKTDADSFPASDPPSTLPEQTPEKIDQAASAGITGVRPNES